MLNSDNGERTPREMARNSLTLNVTYSHNVYHFQHFFLIFFNIKKLFQSSREEKGATEATDAVSLSLLSGFVTISIFHDYLLRKMIHAPQTQPQFLNSIKPKFWAASLLI